MWRYCPSHCDPEYIGLKGLPASKLKNNSLCLHGPPWLVQPEESWPTDVSVDCLEASDEVMQEIKVTDRSTALQIMLQVKSELNLEEIIKAGNFSNYATLLRVTGFVLRFIANCKASIKGTTKVTSDTPVRSEICQAEITWCREIQKGLKLDCKFKRTENGLGIYTDKHDVLRCRGRTANADLLETTKVPIYLPKDNPVVNLIIEDIDAHRRVIYSGVKDTLAEIRVKFWINKGRQYVSKILYRCNICRRHTGPHYKLPVLPHLPSYRVDIKHAFLNVGTDYAGPLFIKDPVDTSKNLKAYILIFVCATTRNIHPELLNNMETSISSRIA